MSAHAHFSVQLKAVIAHHRIAGVVIGWPLDPFGHESAECRQVSLLVNRLRSTGVVLPVLLWDERGSSAQAKANIRAHAATAKVRDIGKATRLGLSVEQSRAVDEEAALIILRSFQDAARSFLNISGAAIRPDT